MKLTSIEQQGLANFKNGLAPSLGPDNDVDAWTRFGLEFLMEAGRSVRSARLGALDQSLQFKADQTPSVLIERTIEERLRGILSTCASTAAVFGEEGGGQLKRRGITVAIDPIDGTWSFLSRSETITTSLAMFKDAQVFLGMISNPATGEIGYASPGNQPRLLQFSVFGEDTQGTTLPLQPVGKRVLLVNAHPSRGAGPLFERLFAAWNGEQLQMVKAVGGSPSWGLFEALSSMLTFGRNGVPIHSISLQERRC